MYYYSPERTPITPDPDIDSRFIQGYVQDQVIRTNTMPYIIDEPLRVLETGTFGRDAIWLARMGHEVVMVEEYPGSKQYRLEEAEEAGVELQAVSPDELLGGELEPFDLVLSRFFRRPKRYRKGDSQPDEHIQMLSDHVASDGIVSVVAGSRTQVFGHDRLIRGEKSVQAAIERSGLHVDAVFGGAFQDLGMMQMDTAPRTEVEAIITKELEMSRDPLRRSMGNIAHFICTKEIDDEYEGEM